MTLAGLSAPSFASDAPKAPPKEKEPTYANEEGATGRSGNVYKRILKDPRGAPEPLTKEEPKPTETKKEDKEEKAKAGDPAPKKEEKHDDGHGAPCLLGAFEQAPDPDLQEAPPSHPADLPSKA